MEPTSLEDQTKLFVYKNNNSNNNNNNNNNDNNNNNNNNKLYLYSVYIINCSRRFTKNVLKL